MIFSRERSRCVCWARKIPPFILPKFGICNQFHRDTKKIEADTQNTKHVQKSALSLFFSLLLTVSKIVCGLLNFLFAFLLYSPSPVWCAIKFYGRCWYMDVRWTMKKIAPVRNHINYGVWMNNTVEWKPQQMFDRHGLSLLRCCASIK